MDIHFRNFKSFKKITLVILALIFTGCSRPAGSCPSFNPVDLVDTEVYSQDKNLPFRFPLDNFNALFEPFMTHFAEYGITTRGKEYHAAEDTRLPAGTPVYSMADGEVSYSGTMGGYGWLIIVDHPQANLYSLYGHLSPSRWRIEPGMVEKGDLIGYLGDSDENGGSAEQPLITHLHFGVRAGQRADYPGRGEWRWMAGWIAACPKDLNWMQPSMIITNQQIPMGGFPNNPGSFFSMWGVEIVLGLFYLIGGISVLVFTIKRDKPFILLLSGLVLLIVGWFFSTDMWRVSYLLFGMSVILFAVGIVFLVRRFYRSSQTQS
jgi:hypothetical protein